jgi:hypothetical protein
MLAKVSGEINTQIMKSPGDLLDKFYAKTLEIPNERPDLLQADAKRRYIKAGVAGAFAVANYFASSKSYLPSIQPEAHVANSIAFVGGSGMTFIYGLTGVIQRFRADELYFEVLEKQFEDPENPSER